MSSFPGPDVLARWRSRTAAAGARHMERELAERERNRRRRAEVSTCLTIAEDAESLGGSLPSGAIARRQDRRQ